MLPAKGSSMFLTEFALLMLLYIFDQKEKFNTSQGLRSVGLNRMLI